MPSFEVYMNLFWLPVIAIIAAFVGFMLRSSQIKKSRQKIVSLENEMLQNHAEILQLQKDIVRLQGGLRDSKTPVVSIKESSEDKASLKERK